MLASIKSVAPIRRSYRGKTLKLSVYSSAFGMSPMIIKAMASNSQRKDTAKNAYSAKGVEESINNA
jgi:hypothetical protein